MPLDRVEGFLHDQLQRVKKVSNSLGRLQAPNVEDARHRAQILAHNGCIQWSCIPVHLRLWHHHGERMHFVRLRAENIHQVLRPRRGVCDQEIGRTGEVSAHAQPERTVYEVRTRRTPSHVDAETIAQPWSHQQRKAGPERESTAYDQPGSQIAQRLHHTERQQVHAVAIPFRLANVPDRPQPPHLDHRHGQTQANIVLNGRRHHHHVRPGRVNRIEKRCPVTAAQQ